MDPSSSFVFSPPGPGCVRASAADAAALVELLGERALAHDLGDGLREPTALLEAGALLEAASFLKHERGYQFLRSVTAVDFHHRARPRFQVVIHLTAIPAGMMAGDARLDEADPPRLICLKVGAEEAQPVVPSLSGLYPTAGYHERETYDMFGIDFSGHADLRRILMPEDYQGYPLRKDHPLRYEEVAFSFNQETVYASKPFAEE